ncbi:hypothetical protein [Paenarthrobacter aurescens]|uniref:Uncharacterized protein n=1 Tax=Paenarthrobacter aurescens TaxID=43663 RepID=A0A4Y3NAF8_PAEAU|nr:hypothetical protein [Paenarthrobacter aurescens]MDO6142735.1 hypothetical protein [Paenarthrobacter aurescens]MDO6157827.1 hypothetical protein [Paenarthrobacter aurescens]GEB18864.1 hypothetical protein AAU01_16190 [Paenarthrobacter aurescens]
MTTTRKIRVLNIAATILLLTILTLQFAKVIDGFWTMTLLVLIGAPTIVAWVILERRQGAEETRGSA